MTLFRPLPVVFFLVIAMNASADVTPQLPAFSALLRRSTLPDPLQMLSGEPVSTSEAWEFRRRPELKRMFQHYMYGFLPPTPNQVTLQSQAEYPDALDGKADLKLVTISTGDDGAPQIDLAIFVPKGLYKPAPAFLAMNFCGNHAISADTRIPLARGWLYDTCGGVPDGKATELGRGSQASDWKVEHIIARGYALATFCSSDIDADRKDVSSGIYAWLARPNAAPPHDRGSIAAWAWGFHRCIDYLVTDAQIDAQKIAVVGHSRNGKTALLAAAFDERIALAIPHQAGCGGTAPSRSSVGESVQRINDAFPHWFNAEFKKFNSEPTRLPFDQHCLIALVAPRPVLLSNAVEDTWANPDGQFEMLRAAAPVYALLGVQLADLSKKPEQGRLLEGPLGYYIRAGKHSMTADDWRVFMDFADAQFKMAR